MSEMPLATICATSAAVARGVSVRDTGGRVGARIGGGVGVRGSAGGSVSARIGRAVWMTCAGRGGDITGGDVVARAVTLRVIGLVRVRGGATTGAEMRPTELHASHVTSA